MIIHDPESFRGETEFGLPPSQYEGRLRKRGRPSLFLVAALSVFALNISPAYSVCDMPATLVSPKIADRLKKARRVQSEINKLEQKLVSLLNGVPKNLLVRNRYGFTATEMTRIARNLHARAKERIARGQSSEFRGSIEEIL